MATLRDIRKRIHSVRNTQKITKAMKMVAAAKLRRAQMAVIGARPYAGELKKTVLEIAARSEQISSQELTKGREKATTIGILVFTSNRGLCGGFNSNLLRKTENFISELKLKDRVHHLQIIGKKGRDYFHARAYDIRQVYVDLANELTFPQALDQAQINLEKFKLGEFDEFYLCYNKFHSAISHAVTFQKLLPLEMDQSQEFYGIDYIYEPGREEIFNTLLLRYLATEFRRAHLESVASELGARMSAMENATKNASDMISLLTLQYNRARQAVITKDLMDIVNGAEAMS